MQRAEAGKLLPHPAIGTAPVGATTLVNIQTILWLATSADRTLGTVHLLGQRVDLRAHLARSDWSFGDDTDDVVDGPGRAYSRADPCTTRTCPGYFGHVYRETGRATIDAQLVWTGQFRVNGGGWQDIPGTVVAPATPRAIVVKEARGVLVTDPGH